MNKRYKFVPESSRYNLAKASRYLTARFGKIATKISEPPSSDAPATMQQEMQTRFTVGRYIHDNLQQDLHLSIQLLRQQAENLELADEQQADALRQINQQVLALLNHLDLELNMARQEIAPPLINCSQLADTLTAFVLDDVPRLYPDSTFILELDLEELRKVCTGQNNAQHVQSVISLLSLFVREGVRNIYKHAHANRIEVRSRRVAGQDGEFLALSISDNGRGLATAQLARPNRKSNGQISSFGDFAHRAEALGGFAELANRPEGGTRWEIFIPLPKP